MAVSAAQRGPPPPFVARPAGEAVEGVSPFSIIPPAVVKRTASVEEILAAIEAARDKVMADEVKSLTKLGIPKTMAYQMIASRFHQKVGGQEDAEPDPFEGPAGTSWDEIG